MWNPKLLRVSESREATFDGERGSHAPSGKKPKVCIQRADRRELGAGQQLGVPKRTGFSLEVGHGMGEDRLGMALLIGTVWAERKPRIAWGCLG